MADISLEAMAGKLNRIGYETFMQALRQAKGAGNRNVELVHWLTHILQNDRCDLALTADHFKIDRGRLAADLSRAAGALRRNETEMPDVSRRIFDLLEQGWIFATLYFGETQIRTGHLLAGAMKSPEMRRAFVSISDEFRKIPEDAPTNEHRALWAGSDEESLRPIDGSGVAAAGTPGAEAQGANKATALARFSQDLSARAERGELDPVLGRDDEIRQIVDVLMRRRQNNPILTGEAGVGKTAIVEGLALKIAAGDVPPALRGVRIHALDVTLMQAGASMKGEFEQRLRAVVDEVQASATPIVLFIDEAHTLIGAGGAAGTGDAANILKPALARGSLRTIAATTWSEYRQHIEKDPALTRRFQPVQVGEPDVERCCVMLRGALAPMEKHHGVRISDAAIVAAVNLSSRYIPARQLPDKAVSLLDTACARVAISQNAVPAALADARAKTAALQAEKAALLADADLGATNEERIGAIEAELAALEADAGELEADWTKERALMAEISALRAKLAEGGDNAETRAALGEKLGALSGVEAQKRMVYAHVDAPAVAAVVSDWTGIPVGRMVRDEIENVLRLPEILNKRVVGQSHGLEMIAKRVETSRAGLDNPGKPIGVFMLCGPSGVGKTETALALAEALYGGEQNVITINMSEFQEAHTVSGLKGAPPGYVGYGEGGRLTEAVRRKPYSVVLLDEIEKAHPDVHELFFQVFDKGVMEDGTGRRIDFKNTLIILTSNVGTDVIMRRARDPSFDGDAQALASELRPALLDVFPPALLGRLVVIPYLPLSPDMLKGIVRLNLARVGRRVREAHDADFSYDEAVVERIGAMCDNPDSGGRAVDEIVTGTLLPALSREFLKRALAKDAPRAARVLAAPDGGFAYEWT